MIREHVRSRRHQHARPRKPRAHIKKRRARATRIAARVGIARKRFAAKSADVALTSRIGERERITVATVRRNLEARANPSIRCEPIRAPSRRKWPRRARTLEPIIPRNPATARRPRNGRRRRRRQRPNRRPQRSKRSALTVTPGNQGAQNRTGVSARTPHNEIVSPLGPTP